jgi:CBS domain containing-hemolysin-like protein
MPTQLHAQARMMHHIAVVTSLVTFFRTLGGILALTVMSSVVNNKVASAFSGQNLAGSFNSLTSIQALPPAVLLQVQNAFSHAIRWAYIALLPFVCTAALSSFFLREVKIPKKSEEEAEHQQARAKEDAELGQVPNVVSQSNETQRPHRKRITVFGPISGIIWCCQAIADKYGWRK